MNQILFVQKNNKNVLFFYIQFAFSISSIIILFIISLNDYTEKNISEILEKNVKISRFYENNNDIYFGRIIIKKINLDYMILNDFTDELLKISICKFYGKSLDIPDNICLVGHNYENSKFFSRIDELENGDEIIIVDLNNNINTYKVYEKAEVEPSDTSILIGKKKYELTLLTCNNSNKKRRIIKAYKVVEK